MNEFIEAITEIMMEGGPKYVYGICQKRKGYHYRLQF